MHGVVPSHPLPDLFSRRDGAKALALLQACSSTARATLPWHWLVGGQLLNGLWLWRAASRRPASPQTISRLTCEPRVWFCRTDQRALDRPLIPSPGDCHSCSILTVAPGTRQEHENNRHTAQINNARNAPPPTFTRRMLESEHEDTSVQARHHWHALTFCPARALSPRSKRQDHKISFHVNKL